MATKTSNLALEIAELCQRLQNHTNEHGDVFLAKHFQVEPWTPEFYRIISEIMNRTEALSAQVEAADLGDVVTKQAKQHIASVRSAFDRGGLTGPWHENGGAKLGPIHSGPLMMLSVSLRDYSYAVPDQQSIDVMRSDAEQLLEWLLDHQLREQDFIRECLVEGVRSFLFRLGKLGWLGWGYAAESLKDVIATYMLLERGVDMQNDPVGAAMKLKVFAGLKQAFSFVSGGREAVDNANFLLEAAKGAWRVAPTAVGYVAGLLSAGN